MLKKKYLIIMVFTLLLTGCKSEKIKQVNVKTKDTDNTFIMVKNEESNGELLSEFYVKYEGKDKNKIASNIPAYNMFEYLEGKQSMLIQDYENNLVKYDSEGEKEIIGKELIDSNLESISYKVSSNNETVAYLTDDESLYIKEKDKDKDKVANNVWNYEIDATGKYIYYINNENNLYMYNDGKNEKIASDVYSFKISNNGETVVFLNNEENLYVKNINNEDKEKINSGMVEISSVNIYENGIVTFLNDFDYDDYKGELYIYNGTDKNKIASDVIQYIKKDDKFYFINEEGILYEKALGDDKSNKLLSDVEYMEDIKDGIVYINKDGNIYSKQDNKDAIKLGKNIMSKELLNVANGEEIIYLTENNDLFIGDNKIAQEVINYVFNSEIISYVTKNKEVHSYNLKDKKDTIEIKNAKDYSYIYLEDQLIFSNSLEPYELAGFWEVTPPIDYESEKYVLEFSGNTKLIFHNTDGQKNTTTYKVENSSENYMNIKTKDDDTSITIERKDDKKIYIYIEDFLEEGIKISKSEADKIINKKSKLEDKNTDKVDENTESEIISKDKLSYSIEEDIKSLIESYEYDYVKAVNVGDPSIVYEHLVYNGKLYNEHSNNIYKFFEKGISETLYEANVENIEKINDKEYRVKVYEKIGIIKEGTEEVKEFNSTYIIIDDGEDLLIREML